MIDTVFFLTVWELSYCHEIGVVSFWNHKSLPITVGLKEAVWEPQVSTEHNVIGAGCMGTVWELSYCHEIGVVSFGTTSHYQSQWG